MTDLPPQATRESNLPPTIALLGNGGTGKTTSLVTFMENGIKVRLLATERNSIERVLTEMQTRKIPLDMFAYHYQPAATASWEGMRDGIKKLRDFGVEGVSKQSNVGKKDHDSYLKILDYTENFIDDRTGNPLGDATNWSDDTAFVIDSLTGLNNLMRSLVVGQKPNPSPGEWGSMQTTLYSYLNKLTSDCRGFFVLIGHIEKETDDNTGARKLMISTIGAKLAPRIPPMFTAVILAKRSKIEQKPGVPFDQASAFKWSVNENDIDLKNGELPISDNMPPSFKPFIDFHRARKAQLKGVK